MMASTAKQFVDREHGPHGKDRFVVVGDLPVEVAVLLLEAFADEPDVDAPHGAACAGGVPEQARLRELLSRDAGDAGIGRPLEVADGQHLRLVQHRHVDGRADVVVLAHHVCVGQLRIDFLEELRVVLGFGKREDASPLITMALRFLLPMTAPPPSLPKWR